MQTKNSVTIPRTMQSLIDGKLRLTKTDTERIFQIKEIIDNHTALNSQNLVKIYSKLSHMKLDATKVIINYLISKINENEEYYLQVYRELLNIQRNSTLDTSHKTLSYYSFDGQLRYCAKNNLFSALQSIFSILYENEKPDILNISIDAGNLNLFQYALSIISTKSNTEILPYIAYMDQDESTLIGIAQDLINKHIGITHSMRAASNAMEKKRYNLFSVFMEIPTMDVKKWDGFLFREAIFYKEYKCAADCLLHKSMTKDFAYSLLKEYRDKKINANHHDTIAIKLLKYYIDTGKIRVDLLESN